MKKFKDDSLYYNYKILSKREKIRNMYLKSSYVLGCDVVSQLLVGNEKSLKLTVPLGLVSWSIFIGGIAYNLRNVDELEKALDILELIADKLKEQGLNVDLISMCESDYYSDGLNIVRDINDEKYYYIYEDSKETDYKYYLLDNDNVEECINDENKRKDITKLIKSSFTVKNKQNKI